VGDRTLDVLFAKDAGVQAVLYLPEGACVAPTGEEDRIIRNLSDLAEAQGES
jgi:phosphoglycolate phosphatase-like HAD superfamily hydrolase